MANHKPCLPRLSEISDKLGYQKKYLSEKTALNGCSTLATYSHGNPKMQVLYPLIRSLGIDANEVFYNRECQGSTKLHKLELLLANCSEEEIEALIPVCESVFAAIRPKEPVTMA